MILVPGGRGQLGHDLAALSPTVRALSSAELDVTVVTAADLAGATAVIQPGGSIRDDEVIRAADEAGLAMVFTGMRHFRH